MEGKKNGIVILTNVDRLTGRGGEESKRRTGFDIREVAYLHHCLEKDMQWNIKYVSINGGESPMDPESMEENKEDPLVQEMLKDRHTLERIKNTEKIDDIEVGSVQFVFIPGCRGVLMDISKSEEVCKLACKVYENKGWIATISHGSAGLLSLKRDREYLIKGIRVTGFTDEEEKQKRKSF